jgi:hypothetical protein
MNLKNRKIILLLIGLLVFITLLGLIFKNCKNENTLADEDFDDRPIYSPGLFRLDEGSLNLNVYVENNLVRYGVADRSEKEIFRNRDDISTFQKWAFFFHKDKKTLWVFSSDVGHTYWQLDSLTGKYNYFEMEYPFEKERIPEEVRSVMKTSFRNLQ